MQVAQDRQPGTGSAGQAARTASPRKATRDRQSRTRRPVQVGTGQAARYR